MRLLLRPSATPSGPTPVLDDDQSAVVRHRGGPLLVLGGPGTGKTTVLVEAVVDRVSRGEVELADVVLFTFSRRAAADLRYRIAARLGRTAREPVARTFHSYAFGVVRAAAVRRGEKPPRLLTSAEQDAIIRDLLAGEAARGGTGWPPQLRVALPTRGFARELRDFLQRAAERGLGPQELIRLGREHGRDEWVAAGRFAAEYAQISALREADAYDPAELIHAAVAELEADPPVRLPRLVAVDEFQETDPAQRRLLALVARQAELIVAADPDQSIFGFRGADPAGVRAFTSEFEFPGRPPPRVLTLRKGYRMGRLLTAATRRFLAHIPPGGPAPHREVVAVRGGEPDGVDFTGAEPAVIGVRDGERPEHLDVAVYGSAGAQAAAIAARLRDAHLAEGVPWSEMAVVVRSTSLLPPLRRALAAAHVPVRPDGDDRPIVDVAVVRHLLLLLRLASGEPLLDTARDPVGAAELAEELVSGPLGQADPLQLRRLRIALRGLELAAGRSRSSSVVLADVLTDPRDLAGLDPHLAEPARKIANLVGCGRRAVAEGRSVEEVLWDLWQASGVEAALVDQALAGGPAGVAADRDLDAVVMLFDAAGRFVDRLPGASPAVFADYLLSQEIPSDSLAPRAPTPSGVELLTAHSVKGREWEVVVVAGVQEGSWPDLRRRGSILGLPDLLDVLAGIPGDAAGQAAVRLAEERRLCYVAVSRARRSAFVTAVRSPEEQPSRFLDDLDPPEGDERPLQRPPRGLDLTSLVAELRYFAESTEEPRRTVAAVQLARLAQAGVAFAEPGHWYGMLPPSSEEPLAPEGEPVTVSPSAIDKFRRCPLRWLLETCGGTAGPSPAQGVGIAVHAAAARARAPQELSGLLADALRDTDLGTGWYARHLRRRADEMVANFAAWLATNQRALLAVEREFDVLVAPARLVGRVDRLERDREGRLVVVDLKTGKTRPKQKELAEHGQLAAYQVAVWEGGFAEYGTDPGGAELVQLGADDVYRIDQQPPLSASSAPDSGEPTWAHALVRACAAGMAAATFAAIENDECRRCGVRACCPLWPDGAQITEAPR
ncbi:MAG: ATP-dependent helicase [Acidothermus sp.]|nr:ATP-dependent helicase [Acidothermus sp.]